MSFGNTSSYIPQQGDIAWINFMPQVSPEQSGRRPSLILSRNSYNQTVGLALICPITSRIKGYPSEVPIPSGLPITGMVLADQVKSLDWQNRQIEFICEAPLTLTNEVILVLRTLMPLQ